MIEAIERDESDLGANDPVVVPLIANIALACERQGKYGEAEELHRHALALGRDRR